MVKASVFGVDFRRGLSVRIGPRSFVEIILFCLVVVVVGRYLFGGWSGVEGKGKHQLSRMASKWTWREGGSWPSISFVDDRYNLRE